MTGRTRVLFKRKPGWVAAVQWTGDSASHEEVAAFADQSIRFRDNELELLAGQDGAQGWVHVPVGHWIVRKPGDLSDHWPVDPDYFEDKYEPAVGVHQRVPVTRPGDDG